VHSKAYERRIRKPCSLQYATESVLLPINQHVSSVSDAWVCIKLKVQTDTEGLSRLYILSCRVLVCLLLLQVRCGAELIRWIGCTGAQVCLSIKASCLASSVSVPFCHIDPLVKKSALITKIIHFKFIYLSAI